MFYVNIMKTSLTHYKDDTQIATLKYKENLNKLQVEIIVRVCVFLVLSSKMSFNTLLKCNCGNLEENKFRKYGNLKKSFV